MQLLTKDECDETPTPKCVKIIFSSIIPILISTVTILIFVVCFYSVVKENQIKNVKFEVDAIRSELERTKLLYLRAIDNIKQITVDVNELRGMNGRLRLKSKREVGDDSQLWIEDTTWTAALPRHRHSHHSKEGRNRRRKATTTHRTITNDGYGMETHDQRKLPQISPDENSISTDEVHILKNISDENFQQRLQQQNLRQRRNEGSQLKGEHYSSNVGHTNHTNRIMSKWSRASWANNDLINFDSENGIFTVKEPGLYYIYAQVFYLHEQDACGYAIMKRRKGERDRIIAVCMLTHSHQNLTNRSRRDKRENTCFTAILDSLEADDELFIREEAGRTSVFDDGKSFFGLLKLSDY